MAVVVNVNGELLEPAEARVSVFDRGFLYGDSVYETLRTYSGRCFLLPEHLDRLARSASMIGLVLPDGIARIGAAIERTIGAAGNPDSAVRVMVTRGAGPIGLDARADATPTVVIIVRPLEPLPPELYRHGVDVVVARTVRNSPRALDPNIKSGNFLNNILAKQEAVAENSFEALMLDDAANVAEGTQSNVFLVRHDLVVTPGGRTGFLRGITRAYLLELCTKDGIRWEEREVFVGELFAASELFLTSSLKGVLPIARLGGRRVGDSAPGAITTRIMSLYDAAVARFAAGAA